MQQLRAGSIYIGQIIRKTTKTSVSVWFSDEEVGMQAYGPSVASYPIGTIVFCRVHAECRHVDRLRPVPPTVKAAYSGRVLLPIP